VHVLSVVGARPDLAHLAALTHALGRRAGVRHVVVQTGPRHDPELGPELFADLDIPEPQRHLGVGCGSHATQTAAIMVGLEPVLAELRPEVTLVYGDANAALGAALTAAKLGLACGHVDAGLRCGDWSEPEEINRVVTDRLATLLFAPSHEAADNLAREGAARERVHVVGNVAIDSVCAALRAIPASDAAARLAGSAPYVVVTLEWSNNVGDPDVLAELWRTLAYLARQRPVLCVTSPRTRERIGALGIRRPPAPPGAGLRLLDPLGYTGLTALVAGAELVITDSGALQDVTTFLGVPCLTVRPNTARPLTCAQGTNRLVPARGDRVLDAAERALARRSPARPLIEGWDGRAAERIAQVICDAEGGNDVSLDSAGAPFAGALAQPLGIG